MIDKKAFAAMRKQMDSLDQLRETIIKQSRDVLKLSKKAIYSLHRNELKTAKQQLTQAKARLKALKKIASKDSHLASTGAYNEAREEFVEASCYLSYVTKKKIPTARQLDVDNQIYLQGLCDVVGELVRRAINEAIKGKNKAALEIKDTVARIYDELMLFDFRNLPVRRKFDSIKYGLEKLENLALEIKFRRRK